MSTTTTTKKGIKFLQLSNAVIILWENLRKIVLILRAMNHPIRQNMLALIEKNGSMTVTDLYNKLGLEQSVASQHLAILRRANFVDTDRQGKFIYYSKNEKTYQRFKKLVGAITGEVYTVNALEKSALALRALTHPLRIKILQFIDINEFPPVGEIYRTLKLEQSITSQHLKYLRKADLVKPERSGKFIYYSVNHDNIARVCDACDEFLGINHDEPTPATKELSPALV